MIYRRLADFVVVVHLLIAIFFLIGAPFTSTYPWIALAHVPLAVWVSSALIVGWTCPLTPLENRLRVAAGNEGYSGGFVEHYIMPLVTPSNAPGGNRKSEIAIGIVTGVMNATLYIIVIGHLLDD